MGPETMLTNLPAKDVVDLVTTVLLAYHMRQLDRIDNVIQDLGSIEGLGGEWEQLIQSDTPETTIHEYVDHVMNQLEATCL